MALSLVCQLAPATCLPVSETSERLAVWPTSRLNAEGVTNRADGVGPATGLNVTFTVLETALPATSVAWTSMTLPPMTSGTLQRKRPALTVAGLPLQETAATPERLSETVPVTGALMPVTTLLGRGLVMSSSGGVRSMFSVSPVVARLPALSVAEPESVWSAPSVETASIFGHEAKPERVSTQAKLTLTGVWFHPRELAGGAALARIEGGSSSTPKMVTSSASLRSPFISTERVLNGSRSTGVSTAILGRSRSWSCSCVSRPRWRTGSRPAGRSSWSNTTLPLSRIFRASCPAPSTRSVYRVWTFRTEKVSVNLSGPPGRRSYRRGPKAFQVQTGLPQRAVVIVGVSAAGTLCARTSLGIKTTQGSSHSRDNQRSFIPGNLHGESNPSRGSLTERTSMHWPQG